MLSKQPKRHKSTHTFPPNTKCQLTLLLIIEASTCILILAKLENAGLQKAVHTHEGRHDVLDYELGGIVDHGFAAANLKTEAHAITTFHELNYIALGNWAIAKLFDQISVVFPQRGLIELSGEFFELGIVFFELLLVLKSTLVKFFLDALLPDGLVGAVVELSDHLVRQVAVDSRSES